jgi:hypothetical protein
MRRGAREYTRMSAITRSGYLGGPRLSETQICTPVRWTAGPDSRLSQQASQVLEADNKARTW